MKDFWGISDLIDNIATKLSLYHSRYASYFVLKTRDQKSRSLQVLQSYFLLYTKRNYTNIGFAIDGSDGQSIQHFMSDSPWGTDGIFAQIRKDTALNSQLQGGQLNIDECGDECSGSKKAGSARQYLGRLGKVDMGQVGVFSSYYVSGTWILTDGELFFPEKWFSEAYKKEHKRLHIPADLTLKTKIELAKEQIDRAIISGIPFSCVAADSLYGRDYAFRYHIGVTHQRSYVLSVPKDTAVWLVDPLLPENKEDCKLYQVADLVLDKQTIFENYTVRDSERGKLRYAMAFLPIWTLQDNPLYEKGGHLPSKISVQETLIIQKEEKDKYSYALSNDLLDAPTTDKQVLAQRKADRYFVERTFQDIKSSLGFADLQAQKYRAYMHNVALCAMATLFVAEIKVEQQAHYAPPEKFQEDFKALDKLPAISIETVKELLRITMPLRQPTQEELKAKILRTLHNRAASTNSRRKKQKE